jgi:hypothetical protein
MALKRLTAQEMVQLSKPWITANDPGRAAIEKVPLLSALLPRIEEAHNALFTVQVETEDPKAKALSEQEAGLDAEHDALVRGIYGALTMLSEFSAQKEDLLRLRDLMLPEGLEHARKTYRGEAGHAAMLTARLDEATRAKIKSIVLHDKTLADLVDAWLSAANQLGTLEEERARLGAPAATTVAEMNSTRMAWVRVTNALLANAELAQIGRYAGVRCSENASPVRRVGDVQNLHALHRSAVIWVAATAKKLAHAL